jgi:hypothetical protein
LRWKKLRHEKMFFGFDGTNLKIFGKSQKTIGDFLLQFRLFLIHNGHK